MPFRFAPSVTLASVLALSGTAALAQGAGDATVETSSPERPAALRTEVVLGVTGTLEPTARTTLVRLLRAELEPHGLVLVERDPSGEARAWAKEAARDEHHLLAALLDTTRPEGWRLVVIDAARGRAISRDLPRGERDAANVEAIVSIVVSATNALREGLEVASAPLESVVDPTRPKPAAPPPPAPAPAMPKKTEASGGTSLHASVSALAASFAEGAEPTFGGSLALGASIASIVDVDARLARHLPVDVESTFGSFALSRTSLELGAGPVFRSRSFSFVPSLAANVEWVTRTDTRAAAGVASADDAGTTPRFGGVLALRARYRLLSSGESELLSIVGGLNASYFDKRVRFVAGDDVLAEARQTSFGAELGMFISTGAL